MQEDNGHVNWNVQTDNVEAVRSVFDMLDLFL